MLCSCKYSQAHRDPRQIKVIFFFFFFLGGGGGGQLKILVPPTKIQGPQWPPPPGKILATPLGEFNKYSAVSYFLIVKCMLTHTNTIIISIIIIIIIVVVIIIIIIIITIIIIIMIITITIVVIIFIIIIKLLVVRCTYSPILTPILI